MRLLEKTEGGVGVGVFRLGLNGHLAWGTGAFSIWVVGSFSLGHWAFHLVVGSWVFNLGCWFVFTGSFGIGFSLVRWFVFTGHLVVLTGSLGCFQFGFWSRAHGISVFNLASVFKCWVRCNCVCLMVQRWACRPGEVHYIFGGFYPNTKSEAGHLTSSAFNFLKINIL